MASWKKPRLEKRYTRKEDSGEFGGLVLSKNVQLNLGKSWKYSHYSLCCIQLFSWSFSESGWYNLLKDTLTDSDLGKTPLGPETLPETP